MCHNLFIIQLSPQSEIMFFLLWHMLFDLKTKDSGYMVYKCSVGWFSKGISLFRNMVADFNFWFLVYDDVFRISSKVWTCNTYVSVWMCIYQFSSIGLLTIRIMWIYIYTHTYGNLNNDGYDDQRSL